ncbi:conserved hypothetical protein [Candidatus Desulfarcum epimagneticum]|uniref:CopG family transcriptional regulator n=1 Tax=uncultured Desulfobacteraceae bacterium TaxID=218296 RepID=A0A484HDA8_9BACT|nr:conserved hypothetical protein [uncultured Desulfobacteraceae bacterium]
MPNVKTAISVEKSIFERMDVLAKNLNTSRSRLFAMAAREFLQRHHHKELLKSINHAYDDLSESDPLIQKMRPGHHEMVKDQW